MRLMRFNPVAEDTLGKTLIVADTLSRSPLSSTCAETDTNSDVACYMASVVERIPVSTSKMEEIRIVTATEEMLVMLMKRGWPEHIRKVSMDARPVDK